MMSSYNMGYMLQLGMALHVKYSKLRAESLAIAVAFEENVNLWTSAEQEKILSDFFNHKDQNGLLTRLSIVRSM
eukprot:3215751-Rhodomonas_salina.1